MEPKIINLNDWEVVGGGVVGENYFHKTDKTLVLKLSSNKMPKEAIEKEFNMSKFAYEIGIKCPKPYEFVKFEDRYGLISERIYGKKSFAKALGEDPTLIPKMAKWFCNEAKTLHSIKNVEGLPRFIDRYKPLLKFAGNFLSEECISRIQRIIDNAPFGDSVLHGDFHLGNAIFVDDKFYWIDLGDISLGNPIFDMGFMYFQSFYGSEEHMQYLFHMKQSDIKKFFIEFLTLYYPNRSLEELLNEIKPYASLAAILFINFGRSLGNEIANCIKDIVGTL